MSGTRPRWIATTPETHPFPTCFVCGPGRLPGDGLRVFVGPVEGRAGLYAAPWVPDASLDRGGRHGPGRVRLGGALAGRRALVGSGLAIWIRLQ